MHYVVWKIGTEARVPFHFSSPSLIFSPLSGSARVFSRCSSPVPRTRRRKFSDEMDGQSRFRKLLRRSGRLSSPRRPRRSSHLLSFHVSVYQSLDWLNDRFERDAISSGDFRAASRFLAAGFGKRRDAAKRPTTQKR